MSGHRLSLYFLYAVTLLSITLVVTKGWEYYSLPLIERPHHPLHEQWKPSGFVSHGLGFVGSFMVLLLLLYTVRKRSRTMSTWGSLRYWLNYHIWLGVTGPILVLFHTTFKFGGIVSVSFWSMVAVVLSGVLGRYIYVQIPRSLSGQELSHSEIENMDSELFEQLRQAHGVDETTLEMIQQLSDSQTQTRGALAAMWSWLISDLTLSSKLAKVRAHLKQSHALSASEIRKIVKIAKSKAKLRRKTAFLETAQKLLHHWHVFHKPFAIVMILIMFVHIVITMSFGYTWIFGSH